MSDKSEATRLADHIDVCGSDNSAWRLMREAAALLRRWPDGEPVAWYYVEDPWGANEWHFMTDSPESQNCEPRDWTPLYTAPPDQSARITACVNACEGVPIEILEAQQAGGLPWSVADQIDKLAERNELLKALQALMDPATNEDGEWYREARAKARAAIAKATGGAT